MTPSLLLCLCLLNSTQNLTNWKLSWRSCVALQNIPYKTLSLSQLVRHKITPQQNNEVGHMIPALTSPINTNVKWHQIVLFAIILIKINIQSKVSGSFIGIFHSIHGKEISWPHPRVSRFDVISRSHITDTFCRQAISTLTCGGT